MSTTIATITPASTPRASACRRVTAERRLDGLE